MTPHTLQISAEDYHRLNHLSASKISDLAKSPWYFWKKHIDPTRPPEEPTAAMADGTIAHCCLFEPALFQARYARVDVERRGTKEWKAAEAINAGRICLKAKDYDEHMEAAAALSAHPLIKRGFGGGQAEVSAIFSMYDLTFKSRFDLLRPNEAIFDLKKVASIEGFEKSFFSYGYHRQAAIYSEAHRQLYGTSVPFYFVAFELKYPYPVRIFQSSDEVLLRGAAEVSDLCAAYKNCVSTNEWPDNSGPYLLELPNWMREV